MKELRKNQGFQSTGFKLILSRIKTDGSADEMKLDWDEEICRQMDEARRVFQQQVHNEMDRYKKEKAAWKAKKRRVYYY